MCIKSLVHTVKCAMSEKLADICKPAFKNISEGKAQSRHILRRVSTSGVDGISEDSVEILGSTTKGEVNLLTLKALWIREIKPYLNTQDTIRSRYLKLAIKLRLIFFYRKLC